MMSKFHKTTYSRPQNFNAVNSSHGKRNPPYVQQNSEWAVFSRNDLPFEKKIDI